MMTRYAALALALAATPLAAQQRPAPAPAPAAARPATPRPAAPPAAQRPGTPAQRPGAAPAAQRPGQPAVDSTVAPAINYNREVYHYQGAARDPFASLVTEAASASTFADLRLVSVIYDPRGGSIAVIRDKNNSSPHRVRVGQSIGRLRVIQIRPYEVVFQIEEFGFERQEVLTLQRPGVNR